MEAYQETFLEVFQIKDSLNSLENDSRSCIWFVNLC